MNHGKLRTVDFLLVYGLVGKPVVSDIAAGPRHIDVAERTRQVRWARERIVKLGVGALARSRLLLARRQLRSAEDRRVGVVERGGRHGCRRSR